MNIDDGDNMSAGLISATMDDTTPTHSTNTYPHDDWINSALTGANYPTTITTSSGLYGTGSSGGLLTTDFDGNLSWSNPYTINTSISPTPRSFKVEGDAEFHGDIKVKGVSLHERFNAIEERLGILRPNNDLEGKWEKLKALGEEYRKLEKEILEGEQIWETLKK